jgi:hypothetical protein
VNWQPVIEFLVSLAYGILSALVPIFNSEIYIVASQGWRVHRGGHDGGRLCCRTDHWQGRNCGCLAPGRQFPSGAAATRTPTQAGRSLSDKAASLVGPHGGVLG